MLTRLHEILTLQESLDGGSLSLSPRIRWSPLPAFSL
jgi:hypothetical protein